MGGGRGFPNALIRCPVAPVGWTGGGEPCLVSVPILDRTACVDATSDPAVALGSGLRIAPVEPDIAEDDEPERAGLVPEEILSQSLSGRFKSLAF